MRSEDLLQILKEQTEQCIHQAEKLRYKEWGVLTWREHPAAWNILECLQHLNLYSDFYLPEIEKSIKASNTKKETEFKHGILGGYFSRSMMPKGKLNKMKTFKDKNPLNEHLDRKVIERFLNQQIKLLELLEQAGKVSLNKVKVRTSVSNIIKLKLGDTFQFLINHNLRHMKQIERILLQTENA